MKTKITALFSKLFTSRHLDLFTITERISEKTTGEGTQKLYREIGISFQRNTDPEYNIGPDEIETLYMEIQKIVKQEKRRIIKGDPFRKFDVGNEIITQRSDAAGVQMRRSILIEIQLFILTEKTEK